MMNIPKRLAKINIKITRKQRKVLKVQHRNKTAKI